MAVPFSAIGYQALRLAGQITPGATASPEMMADALFECNAMIDSWGAQELSKYFYDDRYFAITVSQQSYTLGPSGTFSVDVNAVALTYRPERITRANLVLLTNVAQPTRIPLEIINVEDYADIPVLQVVTDVPQRMYVQPTIPNVTLYFFPYPSTGNQFEFFMAPGTAQFASQAATFAGPPGYLDWMTRALAVRMYLLTTKDVGLARQVRFGELQRSAREAERVVFASNAPTPQLNMDLITETGNDTGAPFNYLTGDYSQS